MDPPVHYLVDRWDVSGGLPANNIKAITQTPDGYLWIVTPRGLVRYDGLTFKIIPFAGGNTIPDTLYVDREGMLWIGSSAGLTLYNYRERGFTTHTPGSGKWDRVRRIGGDVKGNTWVSFFSSRAALFSDGKFTLFDETHGLTGKKINAFLEDRNGNLLLGTRDNGIFIYKSGTFSPYPIPGLDNHPIIYMYEDRDGNLWIGTGSGLYRSGDGETRRYTVRDGLADNYITYITGDISRNLWVGTIKGLTRFRPVPGGKGAFETVLESVIIAVIFEDREQSLWVGTYNSGIRRLKEGTFSPYPPLESQPGAIIFSMYFDANGDTWAGVHGGRLYRCRGTEILETIDIPGIGDSAITAITRGPDGNLWLGTNGNGVIQKKGNKYIPVTTRDGLPDNVVTSLYADNRGRLWVCTFDGVGIIEPDGGVTAFQARHGLSGRSAYNVYRDRSNGTWIASDGGITYLSDGSRDKIYYLEGIPVTCLYEDPSPPAKKERVFWISTHGKGLKRLSLPGGTVTSYTTRDGMTSDFIYRFFIDPRDNFWFMSNSGILRIDKKELESFARGGIRRVNCVSYGIADGLPDLEFNNQFSRHSALRTNEGEFRFITRKGIACLWPARVRVDKTLPPVSIESVTFDRRPVHFRGEVIQKAARGVRDFRFNFTAPTFLSPHKIRFRYRLEGHDPEWKSYNGRQRWAHYRDLEPGTYTFRVIARSAAGAWNRTGASVTFTLRPYFYQTPAFKILLLLFIIALAAAGVYLYKKYPIKEKYKGSSINPKFAEACVTKLKYLMEEEKIYRDADISLPLLAEKLSVSPHQLSQLLNERLNRGFSDFVNGYRVEEAKKNINQPPRRAVESRPGGRRGGV